MSLKRTAQALAAASALASAASPAQAVVILDSTWAEEGGTAETPGAGFGAHIALAHEPQFGAAVAFSTDGEAWGACSGTWIGNDDGAGYVMTSAHCFSESVTAASYYFRCGSEVLEGAEQFTHPDYLTDGSRAGFDVAIVKLSAQVTDCGEPATLYAGSAEKGALMTFVGFGSRGIGSVGQQGEYYAPANAYEQKAAAQGTVDAIEDIKMSDDNDAGNWLWIFLPKEDGSIANSEGGSNVPATRLVGLVGSGDSGSGAYIQLADETWVVVGVSSNASRNSVYGEDTMFARVSGCKDWIASVFPGAQFAE
jgi:hypothetical protein